MLQKKIFITLTLISMPCLQAMQKPTKETDIFDRRTWNESQKEFTHYRNTTDEVVRPINGAGVLPVVYESHDSQLYFLLSVAVVENGTDEAIGKDPVYVNPSNYPAGNVANGVYESSIEMAARAEELGIISSELNTTAIKNSITKNGKLLPNAGMVFGKYAVPTYIVYLGYCKDLKNKLAQAEQKIQTNDYNQLFPTASAIKRSDTIKKFELVPAQSLLKAIKEQGEKRIEKPLVLEGCSYKLSPYLARTIALQTPGIHNTLTIEKALQEYAKQSTPN